MHKFASLLAGVGFLILAACGGSSNDNPAVGAAQPSASTSTTSVAVATTVTTAPVATSTPAPTPTTVAAAQKVNANTASQSEIQAALTAANVPSAAQWSREVTEYRPYPTNDPTFAKLRQNLAKYNPGPGVVDQIISVLSL